MHAARAAFRARFWCARDRLPVLGHVVSEARDTAEAWADREYSPECADRLGDRPRAVRRCGKPVRSSIGCARSSLTPRGLRSLAPSTINRYIGNFSGSSDEREVTAPIIRASSVGASARLLTRCAPRSVSLPRTAGACPVSCARWSRARSKTTRLLGQLYAVGRRRRAVQTERLPRAGGECGRGAHEL